MTLVQPVFLLLGSNINKEHNMQKALTLIAQQVPILKQSHVYLTDFVGANNQPPCLNQAVEIRTALSVEALKQSLIIPIETECGRIKDPSNKHAPRTMDIDICLVGDHVINEAGFCIPDPNLERFRFTLEPITEIAPNFIHPTVNLPLKTLLAQCPDKTPVKRLPSK